MEGFCGGIDAPYGTLCSTIGIGNPIPPALTGYGSGDNFWGNTIGSGKPYTKRGAPAKTSRTKQQSAPSVDVSQRPLLVMAK